MPWLRHRRWTYATPLAPAVTVCQSGRVYMCAGTDGGAVDVPYKADVDEMLHPAGDRSSDWEVAWERYGVVFNGNGHVVVKVEQVPQANVPQVKTAPVSSSAAKKPVVATKRK